MMFTMAPSERLTYRLMDVDDSELFYQLNQDPEVMKYISGGKPSSRDDIEQKLMPRLAKYRNPEKGWGVWQVKDKQSDEFIGFILIRPMYFFTDAPHWNDLEIGWRFKRHSWRQGFASEAAKHIMQTLIAKQQVKYFSAIVDAENLASIGVMKKLGMDYLKTDTHPDVANATVEYYQFRV